jgi:hypothetical protein
MSIFVGILFVVHGLIHLLYFGQSASLFELQAGMNWPDGSWALAGLLGVDATRFVAAGACILAALGFIVGGVALFASFGWWKVIIVASAVFSTALYLLLWDGKMQGLSNSGLIAIVINIAILVSVLILHWPRFSF